MKSTLTDLDMSVRFGGFVAAHFLIYGWTRYVVAPAGVGWSRLVLSAFLIPLFLLLCVLFDVEDNKEFAAAVYTVCNFIWLTPFKILALCMNRGQLVKAYDSGCNAAFVFGLLFPVAVAFDAKPVSKESEDEAKKRHAFRDARFSVVRYTEGYIKEAFLLMAYILLEFVFMAILKFTRRRLVDAGHMFVSDFFTGWYLYASTTFMEEIFSLFAMFTVNVKMELSFNKPWLAQSVKELWAIRYNLTFAKTLRDLTYDPIYEGRWIAGPHYFDHKKPSSLRRRASLFSTFVLSGIMHMAFSRSICTRELPFLHGAFFVINGIIVLLEDVLKPTVTSWKLGQRILKALPSLFFQVYVILTLFVLTHFFFWPELDVCDYRERALNNGLVPSRLDTYIQSVI